MARAETSGVREPTSCCGAGRGRPTTVGDGRRPFVTADVRARNGRGALGTWPAMELAGALRQLEQIEEELRRTIDIVEQQVQADHDAAQRCDAAARELASQAASELDALTQAARLEVASEALVTARQRASARVCDDLHSMMEAFVLECDGCLSSGASRTRSIVPDAAIATMIDSEVHIARVRAKDTLDQAEAYRKRLAVASAGEQAALHAAQSTAAATLTLQEHACMIAEDRLARSIERIPALELMVEEAVLIRAASEEERNLSHAALQTCRQDVARLRAEHTPLAAAARTVVSTMIATTGVRPQFDIMME